MSTHIKKIKMIEFDVSQLDSFKEQKNLNKRIKETSKKENSLKIKINENIITYTAYIIFDYEMEKQNSIISNALFGTNKMLPVFNQWELELEKQNPSDEELETYIRKTWASGDKFLKEDIEAIKAGWAIDDETLNRYTPIEKIPLLIKMLEKIDIEKECKQINNELKISFDESYGNEEKKFLNNMLHFYKTALENKKSVLYILYLG